MKKLYISPSVGITKVKALSIMAGTKAYDSGNRSESDNPGFGGTVTDAGSEDETAKYFGGGLWED